MDNLSIIQQAVQTPHDEALLMSMMEEENISADELLYSWELFARPSQLTPKKDWLYWLICSGRGFGKTRAAAEWIRNQVENYNKRHIALVGATAADVRDTMVMGVSGILSVCPPWNRPEYIPSKRVLIWPNGATATTYSAEKPDRLRGPAHDCFIAGTKIRTMQGKVSIEYLKIGDKVLTRKGERKITDYRSRKHLVGRVTFSNGIELTGTKDHPIMTNYGWKAMSGLKKGDCALCFGMKDQMDIFQGRKTVKTSIDIDGYGSNTTEKYQKGIISTIKMGIKRITKYLTLKLCRQKNIVYYTMQWLKKYIWNASIVEKLLLESKMIPGLQYAEVANVKEQKIIENQLKNVFIAEKNFYQKEERSVVSVASTWVPVGKKTVYNMTVEQQHEYYANDILVSNCAWTDELATWQRMQDTWDMLMFGLRIGDKPQCVVSTTPRPVKLIKELIKDKNTAITGGDTFENRANLSQVFFDRIIQKYKGTRLGRQEIYAEILDDNPEALFDRDIIDKYRVKSAPQLVAVSVGVDPAVTSNENSDDTGIIVAGKSKDNHFYILADLTCHKSPDKWARVAVNAYNDYFANKIVAETNNGGDMVKILMKAVDPTVRVKTVTATRGKALRAEPISSLYEQGRVHHVGIFPKLEDQQTQWDPSLGEVSPDRLDAAVWALTDLSKTAGGKVQAY